MKYTQKSYWDERFVGEEHHEWLASYADIKALLAKYLRKSDRILLVGVGTSKLPLDMAADGYTNLTASDYSDVVVRKQRELYAASHPTVEWVTADMTALEADLPGRQFDAVLDKAALDALLADGGDTWEPPASLLAVTKTVCQQTHRVLRDGGVYLMITYSQPHFRLQYMLQPVGDEVASVGGAAAPPAAPVSSESDDEWEQDTPASAAAAAAASQSKLSVQERLEKSLWCHFEQDIVPSGFGYFFYVFHKSSS